MITKMIPYQYQSNPKIVGQSLAIIKMKPATAILVQAMSIQVNCWILVLVHENSPIKLLFMSYLLFIYYSVVLE